MENEVRKTRDYKINVYVYDDLPKTDDEFYTGFSFKNTDSKMLDFIKLCVYIN